MSEAKSNFRYECPKCGTVFYGKYHIGGYCPDCNNAYFWYDIYMHEFNYPQLHWMYDPNRSHELPLDSLNLKKALEFLKKWIHKLLGY